VGVLTTMAGTAVRLCGGRGWASGGVCRDELRRSASQVADAVSFYMAPPLFSRRNAPGSVIVLASTERYYGGGTYSGSSGGDQCKMQGLSKEVATPPPPLPLQHRGAQCGQRRPPQARRGAATHVGGSIIKMGKPLYRDEGGVGEGEHRRPGGAGRAEERAPAQERRGTGGSRSCPIIAHTRLPHQDDAAGASPSVDGAAEEETKGEAEGGGGGAGVACRAVRRKNVLQTPQFWLMRTGTQALLCLQEFPINLHLSRIYPGIFHGNTYTVDRLLELLWLSIGRGPQFGPSIGWNLCCQINQTRRHSGLEVPSKTTWLL